MSDTDDTDESAVLVELCPPDEDAPELVTEKDSAARAYQIVSIGSEDDAYAFQFDAARLQEILDKIPADCKVSVVSVVGAFRTGKSFLLSWFLRYLAHLQDSHDEEDNTDTATTSDTTEPWYSKFDSLGNDGFDWKAGSERNTTGIWMWQHPHIIKTGKSGEKLAVLLVDTQGMFDHETTMALTASIFGFSTLLSSYQIYNVDKRIQEDNLQQLALFSEYARTAMSCDKDAVTADDDDEGTAANSTRKPFQQMEFLVRDWQHFEEDEDGSEDYEAMEKSMEDYLQTVIAERDAKDLQDTRVQITSCFEKISCYGLSHPGFAVTKKKYAGEVGVVEEQFMHLLDRYCQRVFSPATLQPKVIHGRELTAAELGTYIQTYADLFASGAKFPTAATLLEATASANNTNALNMAVTNYKETMDRIAGPRCTNYLRPDELEEEHKRATAETIKVFAEIATFGSKGSIKEARDKVEDQVQSAYDVYDSLNKSRNPLLGLETYVLTGHCAYTIVPFIDYFPSRSHAFTFSGTCFPWPLPLLPLYCVGSRT
jgi:atlastin